MIRRTASSLLRVVPRFAACFLLWSATAWLPSVAPTAWAATGEPSSERPLRVVATLGVLADLASELGGELVEVDLLADPRQDPHFVQARPTLMKKARRADIFLEFGLALDLWADRVIEGSGNTSIQRGSPGLVTVASGLAALEVPAVVSRAAGDVHPQGNPHAWLDPANVRLLAGNIAAGFARVAPDKSAIWKRRLEAFLQRLDLALFGEELTRRVGGAKLARLARDGELRRYLKDKSLLGAAGGWLEKARPLRGKVAVSYHSTWSYFARRFGLIIPLHVEEKPGIPPSAKHRDRVVELVRDHQGSLLLMAGYYERSAIDFVARHTGAKVVELPVQPGASEGVESYFELMDYIISSLVEAVG